VLRSERIKLASLRSIRITLATTLFLGLALSIMIAALWSADVGTGGVIPVDPLGYQSYLLMVATFSAPFLALVFGVLGVFAISSEYSTGMILSTLAAVPRRTPVLVAKAAVTAVVAAITAGILVVGGLGIGVAFLPLAAPELGSVAVISGALGTITYLACIALFAFGISALLRSTAGGIAVVAGVTFVLPVVFQVLSLLEWEWVLTVSNVLPAALGNTLAQGIVEPTGGLSFWGALAAMLVWVAAALIPASIAFARRDAR